VLSSRALIAKFLGITLALGSGIIVGKEGPFIHLTAIIANQLVRLPYFEAIRKSDSLMQIMLGAACATGVASHFGAAVGGVLFSIEITSTYYPTRNYWYAYLGTVSGAMFWNYLWNAYFRTPGFRPLIISGYQNDIYFGIVEMFLFGLLGLATGVLSVGFVKLNAYGLRTWRNTLQNYKYIKSPYLFIFVIGLLTSLVTFPKFIGNFMSLSSVSALSDLTNKNDLSSPGINGKDWQSRNILLNIFLFTLSRYILVPISIIMPIPCGLFVPTLSIGAGIGRLFGEAGKILLDGSPLLFEGSKFTAGIYGVAGAAAFTGAVTHTLSTAVIIFEITGSNVPLFPVLLAVLISVTTARKFSTLGIYDSMAKIKELPLLPDLKKDIFGISAKNIMEKNVDVISKDFLYEDITSLLQKNGSNIFPVVYDKDSMLLVGQIDRDALEDALKKRKDLQELAEHDSAVAMAISNSASLIARPTPIRFLETTPLIQIHLLFITLRLTKGYVTKNGKLKGMISREALRTAIYDSGARRTILGD